VGFQPVGSDGANLAVGVLGPHRICVRKVLDSAQARAEHTNSLSGIVDDFCCYACPVTIENNVEAAQQRSPGMAAACKNELTAAT
jgi:hypothetical protein